MDRPCLNVGCRTMSGMDNRTVSRDRYENSAISAYVRTLTGDSQDFSWGEMMRS